MNIFALDKDPIRASEFLCDKHVVKMILETTQILVSGLRQNGCPDQKLPKNKWGDPYGQGYPHHPSTRWAMRTQGNFEWLCKHGIGIGVQYSLRYGKFHFCAGSILHIVRNGLISFIPEGSLTEFSMAMPDHYKSSDPIRSYREYYRKEKRKIARWKKTKVPEWFNQ